MSDRMTSITLPFSGITGIAEWGRKTPDVMIGILRDYAKCQLKEAQEILAASDNDFKIETYLGAYVRKNREVLQIGRAAAGKDGR